MSSSRFRYLFGPVLTRRMGRSLGIDLVPLKTCVFNCLFCQLGRTPRCTLERREYAPVAGVIAEFEAWLSAGGSADFVTLAGSGEPTLHSSFGRVLDAVRERSSIRRALLTNSSLLDLPEVRAAAAKAEVVKAALSAWDEPSFQRINRPHRRVSFGRVLGGIREFRAEYMGELWLEVFLVAGINDRRDCVERLAALAATIRPDRIQLNTAVRPPAERFVRPVGQRVMESLAALFTPVAEVLPEAPERAGREGDAPPSRAAADRSRDPDAAILGIMARHPCTAADVAQGLGLDVREAHQRIESLVRRGRVRRRKVGGRTCYRAVGKSADDRDDEAIPNRVGD